MSSRYLEEAAAIDAYLLSEKEISKKRKLLFDTRMSALKNSDNWRLPQKRFNPSNFEEQMSIISIMADESTMLGKIHKSAEAVKEGMNGVIRVTFFDGTVAYVKIFENLEEDTKKDYKVFPIDSIRHEVAAYKMAQIMGGGFARLVPKTELYVHNGLVGCIQKGVTGREGKKVSNAYQRQLAGIFDFVIGSRDRHSWNYLLNETSDKIVALIDNEISFSTGKELFINASIFTDCNEKIGKRNLDILKKLYNDGLNGAEKYLTHIEAEKVQERIKMLIDSGRVIDIGEWVKRYGKPIYELPWY